MEGAEGLGTTEDEGAGDPPAGGAGEDEGAGAEAEGLGGSAGEEGLGGSAEGLGGSAEGLGGSAVGGLMSTPADLHRATAALRAFSWSALGQLVSMHLVEELTKPELEQAHLKSVMEQPVAPRPPVKQVRPQGGKLPRPWPKTVPAAAATIMIEKDFILVELVVMGYRLLKR